MKGENLKYFSVCMPYVEKKSKFRRFLMRLFNKKKYYHYMRCLAKQRVEEKIFFAHLAKKNSYDQYITKNIDMIHEYVQGIYND